jgi:hypothetical protein
VVNFRATVRRGDAARSCFVVGNADIGRRQLNGGRARGAEA